MYVVTEPPSFDCISRPAVNKALLPDLSPEPEALACLEREPSFDELHNAFESHTFRYCD